MTDAIFAVEEAWIQSLSVGVKPADPVGTSPRRYIHKHTQFYIKPQNRLNWAMFNLVTFGIMGVLEKLLHNETEFAILGDGYEGHLGEGNVHSIA